MIARHRKLVVNPLRIGLMLVILDVVAGSRMSLAIFWRLFSFNVLDKGPGEEVSSSAGSVTNFLIIFRFAEKLAAKMAPY